MKRAFVVKANSENFVDNSLSHEQMQRGKKTNGQKMKSPNRRLFPPYMSNTPELSRIVWDTQRSDSQEVRSRET